MQELIIYFTIYSVLGWICECIYCAAIDKVWVNRGFLNGPVCPVYGFGALFVIYFLGSFKGRYLILFFISIILTTAIEYITAIILEKAFDLKWWDYSNYKFNYKGRICFINSFLFGILSLFLIQILHPLVINFVNNLSVERKFIVSIVIVMIFSIDLVLTILSLIDLKVMIKKIAGINISFKSVGINIDNLDDKEINNAFTKLSKLKDFKGLKLKAEESYSSFKEFRIRSIIQNRIFKAFPNIISKDYSEGFKKLKENITQYWKNKN